MLKRVEKELITLTKISVCKHFPSLKKKSLKILLEIPKNKKHGNLSTNIALQLASMVKKKPYNLASIIQQELLKLIKERKLKKDISAIEVKQPGFINFFFSESFSYKVLRVIVDSPGKLTLQKLRKRKKIQIEFVSANPTGLLSIAHGRQATIGDTLSNALNTCGYRVTREYFINDEGNQIDALGNSVMARYLELHNKKAFLPKDGYQGECIIDVAKEFNKKFGEKIINNEQFNLLKMITLFSVNKILDEIRQDLEALGVHMDVWFSQKKLSKSGKISKIIRVFIKKGLIYEKDNALWFKSTKFGDDKDRVVVKSSGEYTYLAPDIAYHEDKYKRRFKRVINIWGPDHHGYIGRLQAAVSALGCPKGFLTILIVQLATLYKDGRPVSMSTRKGQYVTLRQLINEVGRDATRFFFLMRKRNTHLDFDLELAKKKSLDNPVYYIQYAHARICSIMDNSKKNNKKLPRSNYSLLKTPEEMDLIRTLIEFPNILESVTSHLEPYFMTVYLRQLAEAFHVFYQKHRVLSDDLCMTAVRLKLIKAVKNVLSQGLTIIGVSLPAKM